MAAPAPKAPAFFLNDSGSVVPVAPDEVAGATQMGWVPASPKQISDFQLQEKYGTGLEATKAFAEHAASAATLGLSDVAERGLGISTPEAMAGREQANPLASGLGTAAGIAGSLLIPGGEATAPGLLSKAGGAVTRGVAEALPEAAGVAGRLAAKAAASGAGSAIEGAAYGLGQVVHEAALGDPNLTAQSALATIGFSTAIGGALGGAGGMLGVMAGAAGRKIADTAPGWLEDVEAHANLQAAGGDKVLARQMRKKFGEEGSKSILLDLRKQGILDGALNTPSTVLERSQDQLQQYGKQIGSMIDTADAAGVVDVETATRKALAQGVKVAERLGDNPFQEAAATRLQATLAKFEQKLTTAPATLSGLHEMEMQFGEEVYGLKGTGDPRANREIEALNKIRRMLSTAVDDGVAEAGVPAADWKAANRGYLVAKQGQKLAQNGLDRLQGNNPLSLTGTIGMAAGLAHAGAGSALATGALTEAGKRYGSGLLGYAARALRDAVDPAAVEALVNKTAEAITVERQSGANIIGATAAAENTPERVASLSILERLAQSTGNQIKNRVGSLIRGESAAAGAKVSGSSGEDAAALFQKRTAQVRTLANDPEQLQSKLAAQTDDWHAHAPNTAQAVQVTSARAVAFLASKLPQNAAPGPLAKKWTPTRAEISKFGRYYEAVNKPTSILKQAAAGTLTPEAVEAVASVYPQLFQKIRGEVVDQLAGKKAVPYRSKLMLSMLMGQDLDGTTSPHALQRNFAMYAAPPPMPKATPARADKLNLASRMATAGQQSADRRNR